MKTLHYYLMIVSVLIFSSCTPHQLKPKAYFPVMNVELKHYFASQLQSKHNVHNQKYHNRARNLLLKSGYFKRLSIYSPYVMEIEYNQYIHTSVIEALGQALNPINALLGVDVECSVAMKVLVKHQGKVIEDYRYNKHFKSRLGDVSKRVEEYFNEFMEQLIRDMVNQSRLKRTE